MTRLLLILALCVLPGFGAAQDWRLGTFDDGSYFLASISHRPGFALSCGERSPQGRSAMDTGNMELVVTRPGVLRMSLADAGLRFPQGTMAPRDDVMIVVGQLGYTLPRVRFDELFEEWWVDLPPGDPVFAAIAGTQGFEIRSRDGVVQVDARGFAEGFAALVAHCQGMFAAIGQPWHTAPAAPAPGPPAGHATMRAAAEADILRGCNGPATTSPDYLLGGEIDGDGREDVVLDWRAVECRTGIPRPFCGAASCSADVYLSSRHPATGRAENLLALGVSLIPLSNGNQGVRVGRSQSDCIATACHSIFYWNGVDLTLLP